MVIASRGLDYVVAVEGLGDVGFDDVPQKIKRFAAQAVNRTATRFRTESSRRIREEIAFPARYLDSRTDGNLQVTRKATTAVLEAIIVGRSRPTALSRFVRGARVGGRKSPTVEVATGRREKMNRAFLINLNSGNVGLAIRLREGERVENKSRMVRMNSGLYLLYGPSVNQVFRQVAEDVEPDAGDFLEQEFLRLSEAFL